MNVVTKVIDKVAVKPNAIPCMILIGTINEADGATVYMIIQIQVTP